MPTIQIEANVTSGDLLHAIEQLPREEFRTFVDTVLGMQAQRQAPRLSVGESVLLMQINETAARARQCCEYCRSQARFAVQAFAVEHVEPRSQGGTTTSDNLAFSCQGCNNHKGTDLASIDPVTKKLTRLFHPRRHKWKHHFRWDGAYLLGKTAIGRVTIAILEINFPDRVIVRQALINEGVFPPVVS